MLGSAQGEYGMKQLLRRLQKLEARRTDCIGLVPFSPEWRAHWDERFDRVLDGDDSVDLRGGALDRIDLIVAEANACAG